MKYSLRSLMIVVTLAAAAMGWWNHRLFCLSRAEYHRDHSERCSLHSKWLDQLACERAGNVSGLFDRESLNREALLKREAADRHSRLAPDYHQAVWQPWIRFWIDDSRPEEPPPGNSPSGMHM